MDYVIDWIGALGAWLLVAGPLNQAALELSEEHGFSREEIERVTSTVPQEPGFSPLWWLLPPVAYAKAMRRGQRQRDRMMDLLSADQTRGMLSFLNKGNGWFLVASGAALIAAKETWELVERMEWPLWAFFVVYAAAAVGATSYTVSRQRRSRDVVDRAAERERQGGVGSATTDASVASTAPDHPTG